MAVNQAVQDLNTILMVCGIEDQAKRMSIINNE